MYKELEKYKTGKTRPCMPELPQGFTSTAVFAYQESEYEIPLGNLLQDFISHNKKNFFTRKSYHDHLSKIYLDMLNRVKISHWL